jgi:SAM-dependent methyltransferase
MFQKGNMKEFWEARHKENNIQSLSGHPGSAIINGLYIKDVIAPGSRLLEIGVGLGICTRDLVDMGFKVTVLDISEEAIKRVRAMVRRAYLESEIETLPDNYYEIAVSYCVVQHMNNQSLARQLKNVIRCLTPNGIYAMQYAIPFHGSEYNESNIAMEAGSVCRPLEMMYDLVDKAGGKIIYHRIWGMFLQYQSGWAIAHIMRKP